MERGYELPDEATADMSTVGLHDARSAGLRPLPQTLAEALDEMEESELVAEALGDHIFEWFIRNKRAEWAAYQRRVTAFEIERYLPSW